MFCRRRRRALSLWPRVCDASRMKDYTLCAPFKSAYRAAWCITNFLYHVFQPLNIAFEIEMEKRSKEIIYYFVFEHVPVHGEYKRYIASEHVNVAGSIFPATYCLMLLSLGCSLFLRLVFRYFHVHFFLSSMFIFHLYLTTIGHNALCRARVCIHEIDLCGARQYY